MAKTVDLRTYLLLEKAFVRRLQRSWKQKSAPIYAAITQACLDHNWNEARRLVPELDMAEVGTENREWITYMLLSCAVFGANTVAKKKPSFVGVGSFDTFLKQTTSNILQYLEFTATARVQMEALQLIATDEAEATRKVAFDPSQPRDKQGQWTRAGAGSTEVERQQLAGKYHMEGGHGPERAKWLVLNEAVMAADEVVFEAREVHNPLRRSMEKKYGDTWLWDSKAFGEPTKDPEYPAYLASKEKLLAAHEARRQANKTLKDQEPFMRKEVVTNLSTDVAEKMGVSPRIIDVVHKDPREFTVGEKQFTEAGHYDPSTGRIELNAQNISYGDTPSVKGITAHELSHAIYHSLKLEVDAEHAQYLKKALTPDGSQHTEWYKERFELVPGMMATRRIKPEYKEELYKEFPAAAAMAGLSDGGLFQGISQRMVDEDGHSAYARSYWTPEARAARGHSYDSAINESIAEITRWLTYPGSWHEPSMPQPTSPWVKLTQAMHEWYAERQAMFEDSARYHPPDAKGRKYGEPGYNT